MMKLKYILLLFLNCFISTMLPAQEQSLAALKLGDKVPDIEFKLLNATKPTIKLSDFKGKLVILDFWATNCGPCIDKFPKLDSLQRVFADKIKIILMYPKKSTDADTKQKINRIMAVQSKTIGRPLNLLVTVDDTVAVQYFPYKAISHFVWIDQEGVFRAASADVKKKEIELMLAGKNAGITQKDDLYVNPRNEAMFSIDTSNIKYKSMFTGYLDGLMDFKARHRKSFFLSDIKGVRLINESLFHIISQALQIFPQPNRVLVEGLNKDEVMESPKKAVTLDWETKNTYCYELIAPGLTKQEIRQQAVKDIKNTFGITAGMENRKVLCWVIKMNAAQQKKLQSRTKSKQGLLSLEGLTEELQNLDIPVVAETQCQTKLFRSLHTKDNFIKIKEADLHRFVKENGLTLSKEEKDLEVFVIKKLD